VKPGCSGLLVLGALTLINTFFGCIGSCYKRSLLTMYLIFGTILTIAQARRPLQPLLLQAPACCKCSVRCCNSLHARTLCSRQGSRAVLVMFPHPAPQAVLVFYIFGQETKVATRIASYGKTSAVTVGNV
jgi:hypothetical protein